MSKCSPDSLLQLVADERRRLAIQHLSQASDGQTTINDLFNTIRDTIGDKGSGTNQTIDQERLAIQMHHVQIPKLAEHGVVDYNPDNGTIRYQPDEKIETLVDSLSAEKSVIHT